jgi:hypothetical protein
MPDAAEKKLFVAVGHDGLRIVSADGQTWTDQQLGKEGETLRYAAFGGGRCLAAGIFGGKNVFYTTADGRAWQPATTDAAYIRYVTGVFYGKDRFHALTGEAVTVGAPHFAVQTSADGLTWEKAPEEARAKSVLRRVAFGNERYVGVGDRGRRAVSTDGIVWKNDDSAKPVDTLIDAAFGAGVFVGVGLHGLRMTSSDGTTWEDRQLGEEGEHINVVLWTGEQFVAVGLGATFFSADGRRWERKRNELAPLTAAYGNGCYVGTRWKGLLVHSADAIVWREQHRCDRHVEAVVFGTLKSTES